MIQEIIMVTEREAQLELLRHHVRNHSMKKDLMKK